MYSEIFEGTRPGLELRTDTISVPKHLDEEEQDFIMEAPIDKPYAFCESIKNSKGPEKKLMDFKTGTNHSLCRNNHPFIRLQGRHHHGR